MLTLILIAMLAIVSTTPLETAEGEVLETFDEGVGETIVLVPGLSGCAFGFRQLVPSLVADGRRVLIVEPLGVGSSGRPAGADYSLTAQADRLAAALDLRNSGRCVIVGHGISGSIVLRLAYRRPDLVRGIISIEGGPVESAVTPAVRKSLGVVGLAVKLGGGRFVRDRFRDALEEASGDKSWIDGSTVRRYFRGAERDLEATIDALESMSRAEEPESLQANLGRIHCPVVLMLGTASHKGSPEPESIEVLDRELDDFHIRTVAGSGHYIFEERPDVVIETILDLVRQAPQIAAANIDSTRIAGGASCVPW